MRVALVIGNSAYPGVGALKNPANDARDIGAKLKRLGFEVVVRTDLKQKEMLRALTDYGEKVTPGSEALFFYAGHGMQVRGRNYLIPVDAEIGGENSVSSEAVDVDQLLDKLVSARLSMVILDACRNNPFELRFRGGGQGLAQINAPTGTLIAYSTAPGKVAADGKGRNGLYTAELLAAMDTPGIKIEDVFKRVRAGVIDKSQGAQTPWESSSLTGDFYFLPDGPTSRQTLPATTPDPASVELAFWESVERANTDADYAAYLEKYPEGQFAGLARNRLAKPAAGQRLALANPTPSGSTEPIASLPLPAVGDFWRYQGKGQRGIDQMTQTVTNIHPDGFDLAIASTLSGTVNIKLDARWNMKELSGILPIRYEPAAQNHQFPMLPGKSWQGRYKGECGFLCDHEIDYAHKIAGWETVSVPAGTFNALRIDSTETTRYSSVAPMTTRRTVWLVPALRVPAKIHYHYHDNKTQDYELESYRLSH